MTKDKKKKKKDKPVNKTPELSKAKAALEAYLKENDLDPTKNWTKDKKHGKKVTELVNKLNKERDKVAAKYPEGDEPNEAKLIKLKEKNSKSKAKAKEDKKAKAKAKEDKKEPKGSGRVATKYDYPLIDGREMTSAEKKKYRMEQRKLAQGDAPKEKKEKKETSKKESKAKAKEKPSTKKEDKKAKDKKKKKASKEED